MGLYKTPFKDAQGVDSVPKKGVGGKYDNSVAESIDLPGRDTSPNGLAEMHRDTAASSKSPSTSGPYKTPFKDAVD